MDMTRHIFSGSNTARGFCGYFEELQSMAKRALIIKGGPGVGKSTLMKKVGAHYEEKGLEVDYYHCSGDPDSIDAVYVPAKGYLMADGTAPHRLDPVCPGARDGIVNLGVCLNEGVLAEQAEEIAGLNEKISHTFARAYRYLHAAEGMRQDSGAVYRRAFLPARRRNMENRLLSMVPDGEKGVEQHAFLQAITWKGVVQYPELLEAKQMVSLSIPFGMDGDALLQPLLQLARQRDVKRMCWHDPLDGSKLSHLQVGDTLFTTAAPPNSLTVEPELDQDDIRKEASRLSFNRAVYDLCLHQAVDVLAQAKQAHDRLERYYIDAMDFGRLQAITKEVLEEVP